MKKTAPPLVARPSCFGLLAFLCLFMGPNALPALLAALCHEGGHLLALMALGAAPAQVELSALGCRVTLPPGRVPLWGGVGVSLAGPGANLLLWLLCLFMGLGDSPFAGANLTLGLVHLLPIEPLDGGLALRGALGRWLSPRGAALATHTLGTLLLLPLGTLGFWILLRTRYNITLLALSLYLMLYLLLGKDYAC